MAEGKDRGSSIDEHTAGILKVIASRWTFQLLFPPCVVT